MPLAPRTFFRPWIIGLILLAWCLQPLIAQDLPRATPREVGLSQLGLERINATVKGYLDRKQLAGAVTIVARRGRVVHFEAHGMRDIAAGKPMEKDTIFRIYSMTKAIISVGVMMLVEEEKLELEAPVSRYLPSLKDLKVTGGEPARKAVTVRDLLRHTSGLPNNVTVDNLLRQAGLPPLHESTLEEIMINLGKVPLQDQPGSKWHYSFATEVLARLIEVASGQSVDTFLAQHIFKPLRMVDTGFHVPPHKRDRFAEVYGNDLKVVDAPQPGTRGRFTFEAPPKFLSGGGGLVSTASDYMRFCLMLSGQGILEGTRLLKPETVAMMTRNQLPRELLPISRPPQGRGFGLGFAVRVERVDSEPSSIGEYEWLGGAGTEFWLSPRDELVVITLSQQMPMRQLGAAIKPIVYASILQDHYLFLDSRVVQSTRNAKLVLGPVTKDPNNPLFREDKPWEARYDNMYANVIYDEQEQLYKCWYNPFIVDERTTSRPMSRRNPYDSPDYMNLKPNRREEGICYAVSRDGIVWEKPVLGKVAFGGNKDNNLLIRGPSGSGVFKDPRDPDPNRRYKIFYSGDNNNIQRVAFSADGLNWGKPILCPEIEAQGDTHNNAVWSPVLQKYIGIMRLWEGHRIVGRTETADFVKWSKAKAIVRGTPRRQTHDMVIYRAGNTYIGLVGVMRFPKEGRHHVKQHMELAWSPDSIHWERIHEGTPFIGHTPSEVPEKYGAMPYDWGGVFASPPVRRGNEIRIYYGASDWYYFDWRIGSLALARLRLDGWAGYEPEDDRQPGRLITTPLIWPDHDRRLLLSADVRDQGYVRLVLLDEKNQELARSESVRSSITNGRIKWADGFTTEALPGTPVRLNLELHHATLFSFSFGQ